MLRSLTDEIRIVVTPEQIGVITLRLGRPLGELILLEVEDGGWDCALRAMSGLTKSTFPKHARCTVLLSDHFVRYQVLPWQEMLTTDAEWDAFARQYLRTAFGTVADKWRISLSRNRFGTALIAAAVDEDFLQGIEAIVQSLGLRLSAIEPHFMKVFNRYRGRCGNNDFWLAVYEAGSRLCLGKVANGQWSGLSSRQLSETPGVYLQREIAKSQDDAAKKIFVHGSREVVRAVKQIVGDMAEVVALAEGDFPGVGGEIRRLALC